MQERIDEYFGTLARLIRDTCRRSLSSSNPENVGDVNFYVRSQEYGFVEVAHLSLCHAVLDLDVAFGGSTATVGAS